jgi:hypothetical protein
MLNSALASVSVGLGWVEGYLHLIVQTMNRLNQTEPATFSIMLCWAFFRDFYILYLINLIDPFLEYKYI